MKVIKRQITTHKDKIKILPLGDLHIGDRNLDKKLLKETIQRIQDDPDCYCILLGDIVDNAIRTSIGDIYGADIPSPMDQLAEGVRIFEPIKDKILGCVIGNHEERTARHTGIDITSLLCQQLGLADLYSPTSALIWLQIHKQGETHKSTYSIYCSHGMGNGRKPGSATNRMAEISEIIDCDCYLVGHTHKEIAFRQNFFRVDRTRGVVTEVEHLFVNTNAFLKYEGSYGERGLFTPGARKVPVLLFESKHATRRVEAVV